MKRTPNPIDKHVGARLRMRRTALGISQEKLGNALSLTFQQVQKYEKGTNRIGASRLLLISNFLDVSVDFFFEGAPNVEGQSQAAHGPVSPASISEFLATTDGIALANAFVRIKSAELRRSIVNLVERIADNLG
jgi:transcriptional regulator with XRE-family HTH domain